jgi:hypothetical protein
MKVLIFGMPRSGTSSLFNFLKYSLPKKYISSYEPFKKLINPIWGDDCIVKTVLTDKLIFKDGETMLEHSNRIINYFDKVIYIKRKSIENTITSMSDFHQPDLSKEESKIVAEENINRWIKIFDEVTKDKKVYYYEDIYVDKPNKELLKMCDYLEIEFKENLFNEIIHPTNKEFDEKKQKSLI